MFSRDATWRKAARNWFAEHKTAQSVLMMLKSRDFYQELWNIPKLYQLARVFPYTLVSYPGLSGLYDLAKQLHEERVEGAFVECGVWRGGCAAIMAHWAQKGQRNAHFFDSFEGLPEPSELDGRRGEKISKGQNQGKMEAIGHVEASQEDVENILFNRLGLGRPSIHLHKGWFQDTLPQYRDEIGSIALLRLDGDWYESTKVCFENLYDNVAPGGYIIVDDYQEFEGCRLATDEFLEQRGINVQLEHFDWFGGSYFRKPR